MTQEEKIKEAKRLYESANADQRYVLESLFPELKESEDERTWIINYLNNRILNSAIIAEKENLKKAIAWLEKQGEQKSADKVEHKLTCELDNSYARVKFPFKAKVKSTGIVVTIHSGQSNGYEWIKYQSNEEDGYKVYKPGDLELVRDTEPKFKVGDMIIHKELGGDYIHNPHKIIQVDILDKKYRLEGGLVAHFSEQEDYELAEQNSTWSEDDNNKATSILYLLHEIKNYNFDNWLKSLKPQNRWKPSDEQMEALKFACGGNYVNLGVLESLYQDLKKLRE